MNFPTRAEDITSAWLTNILQQQGTLTDQSVQSITISYLGAEKGMTGQLARLTLTYNSHMPTAPQSLIAKFSAPVPQIRRFLYSVGFYERESRFYEQLAPISNLRTPRCFFSALDPEAGYSLLILEDLSHTRNASAIAGSSIADAERAIEAIAPFHAQWWQQPLLEQQTWPQMRGFLSVEQAQPIFDQGWDAFLSTISSSLTEELLPFSDALHQHLGRLSTYLYNEGPRTLIHNDYHSENLFFDDTTPTPSVIVADWQTATLGRGVIDVARLLGGDLSPDDRKANEQRILKSYHSVLLQNGVTDYPFEQCWRDYSLAMLLPVGRIATVIGMTARAMPDPSAQKGGPKEIIVSRYCQALADLEVAQLLNEIWPAVPV